MQILVHQSAAIKTCNIRSRGQLSFVVPATCTELGQPKCSSVYFSLYTTYIENMGGARLGLPDPMAGRPQLCLLHTWYTLRDLTVYLVLAHNILCNIRNICFTNTTGCAFVFTVPRKKTYLTLVDKMRASKQVEEELRPDLPVLCQRAFCPKPALAAKIGSHIGSVRTTA